VALEEVEEVVAVETVLDWDAVGWWR